MLDSLVKALLVQKKSLLFAVFKELGSIYLRQDCGGLSCHLPGGAELALHGDGGGRAHAVVGVEEGGFGAAWCTNEAHKKCAKKTFLVSFCLHSHMQSQKLRQN